MVCITSRDVILDHPPHLRFSMVSVNMKSMNLSIFTSLASTSTADVLYLTSGADYGIYYSLGSKGLCGDWRSMASHGMSMKKSLSRSIDSSITVVYYYVSVEVMNSRFNNIRDSFSTISVHVDAICDFLWTFWYSVYGSVFHIKMSFISHQIHMDTTMCRTCSSQNPQIMSGGRP